MTSIKVAVRCRPLLEGERATGALEVQPGGRRLVLDNKTYDPDYTLTASATQDDVYALCRPVLQSVKEGTHGTIIVYGQTGTGKTYTMLGHDGQHDGVVHKAISELLEHAQRKTADGVACAVTLSMLEIYNERLTDMLSAGGDEEVVLVAGWPRLAHKVTLCRASDAHAVVARGLAWRHTAATRMNERSSRSHVLFVVDVAEHNAFTDDADITHLVLVDLAGSESLRKSQASGSTALETGKINRSLLALKSVLLALANTNEATRPAHVPYRDSKLTELLQDSIGGSARTLFIACISAVARDLDETKSTLMYAVKARSIRNATNTEREKLLLRLRSAEVENVRLRNRLQERVVERGGYYVTRDEHDAAVRDADECAQLRRDVAALTRAHDTSEVHKHVAASQAQYYQALLHDKDHELQRAAQAYATAVQHFDQQATRLQQLVQATVTAAHGSADAAAARAHATLQQWHDELLQRLDADASTTTTTTASDASSSGNNNNDSDWLSACDVACARVAQRLRAATTQLVEQTLSAQAQLRASLTRASQQRHGEVARVCAELRDAIDGSLRRLHSADERALHDETAALAEADAQLRSAQQTASLSSSSTDSDAQTMQQLLRDACASAVRSVASALPPPAATADVHAALNRVVARHRQQTTAFALCNVAPLSSASATACAPLLCRRTATAANDKDDDDNNDNTNNDADEQHDDDTDDKQNTSICSGSNAAAAAAVASLPSTPLTSSAATRRSRFSELGTRVSARRGVAEQPRRPTLAQQQQQQQHTRRNSNNNNSISAAVSAVHKRTASSRSSNSNVDCRASVAMTASARARASACTSRYSLLRNRLDTNSRHGSRQGSSSSHVDGNRCRATTRTTTMPPPSSPPPPAAPLPSASSLLSSPAAASATATAACATMLSSPLPSSPRPASRVIVSSSSPSSPTGRRRDKRPRSAHTPSSPRDDDNDNSNSRNSNSSSACNDENDDDDDGKHDVTRRLHD